MIYMFAALQRFAEQRGDGLLPGLADRLRKMPHLGDGRLTMIDGDTGDHRGEKDIDKSKGASETEARLSAKAKSRGHS